MKSVKESVRVWFGYTRGERRATFVLLLLILTVLGLRSLVPGRSHEIKEIPVDPSWFRTDMKTETVTGVNASGMVKKSAYIAQIDRIEINSCDSAALEALPGIGPVLASRIIKYRRLVGGYVSTDQLKEVYGLPVETFNLISSRITVDTLKINRIFINDAGYDELIRHPYFKRSEVPAILKYRELNGRIGRIGELVENNVISEETGRKIRKYLIFQH